MSATEPTVRMMLLSIARTTIPFLVSRTSWMLGIRSQSVGGVNSRSAASVRSFAAVNTMKMKGTTNTTPAIARARRSSHQLRMNRTTLTARPHGD